MTFTQSNANDFLTLRTELIVCVYDKFPLLPSLVSDYWCNFPFFKNIEKKGIILMQLFILSWKNDTVCISYTEINDNRLVIDQYGLFE